MTKQKQKHVEDDDVGGCILTEWMDSTWMELENGIAYKKVCIILKVE